MTSQIEAAVNEGAIPKETLQILHDYTFGSVKNEN